MRPMERHKVNEGGCAGSFDVIGNIQIDIGLLEELFLVLMTVVGTAMLKTYDPQMAQRSRDRRSATVSLVKAGIHWLSVYNFHPRYVSK